MLLAALLLLIWPPPAAASWRRPVDAPVAARFSYSPARPFARGQRRGADFAAQAGTPVAAPCGGRVTHAGPVPGRRLGVTLHCGRLTATVLGLRSLALRRGTTVRAGARLGLAAGRPPLRLGARVTARRFAYLDPLTLIGPPPPPSRTPAPLRGPPARPAVRPPLPAPAAIPRPRPSPAGHASPVTAWLGAALLAATLSAGLVLPRRRRRNRTVPATHRH